MKKNMVTMMAVLFLSAAVTGCGRNLSEEGVELLGQEKYEQAADKFQEAIKEEKNLQDAYRGLGMAKWEMAEYEAARDAFLSALDNGAKKTAAIYNFLGNCEMQLDNPKGALNYYRLGLGTDSEEVSEELIQEMKFNEIAAYEKTGDFESAKAKLKEYIKAYPDDEKAVKEAEFLETR